MVALKVPASAAATTEETPSVKPAASLGELVRHGGVAELSEYAVWLGTPADMLAKRESAVMPLNPSPQRSNPQVGQQVR